MFQVVSDCSHDFGVEVEDLARASLASACHVSYGFDDAVVAGNCIVVGVDRIRFPYSDKFIEELFLDGAVDSCTSCSSAALFVLVGVVIFRMSCKLFGHIKLEEEVVGGVNNVQPPQSMKFGLAGVLADNDVMNDLT